MQFSFFSSLINFQILLEQKINQASKTASSTIQSHQLTEQNTGIL